MTTPVALAMVGKGSGKVVDGLGRKAVMASVRGGKAALTDATITPALLRDVFFYA